jgi:hypothetical protein
MNIRKKDFDKESFMKNVFLSLGVLLLANTNILLADDNSQYSIDDMAAPITHPTVFEDPRNTTELRPIYIYHKIDDKFVTGGGAVNVYALQARYAVNERFSIIATKDGFVDLNADSVLDDRHGWADIGAGVKYAFYYDPAQRQIVTAGFRYDIPVGEEKVFQGQGDGAFNPFVSAAIGLGPINVMAGTGFRFATDSGDSSFYDFNLHVDTKIDIVHPVLELSVTNVTGAGNRIGIPDEGEDFFNFGASASEGKTLVSAAIGARVDITDKIAFGAAYQFPLTDGAGSNILDYRITSDLIFRF